MFSKKQIIDEIRRRIYTMNALYKGNIINIRGKTKGPSELPELVTEVISEELLKLNIKILLNTINIVERSKGYRVHTHNGVVTTSNEHSNRKEERFAHGLYNKTYDGIGKIIDYQVPLKNSNTDKGLGKIDLISVADEGVYLIELKVKENKETLLRCILEIATYYQVLSKSKFMESYANDVGFLSEKDIKKAILILNGSLQYTEIEAVVRGESPYLRKLMNELDVQVFCLDTETNRMENVNL